MQTGTRKKEENGPQAKKFTSAAWSPREIMKRSQEVHVAYEPEYLNPSNIKRGKSIGSRAVLINEPIGVESDVIDLSERVTSSIHENRDPLTLVPAVSFSVFCEPSSLPFRLAFVLVSLPTFFLFFSAWVWSTANSSTARRASWRARIAKRTFQHETKSFPRCVLRSLDRDVLTPCLSNSRSMARRGGRTSSRPSST